MKRGADAASDHHLVVAELKTKLKAYNDQAGRPSHKFNVQCLKEKQKSEEFKIELRNKFSVLSLLPEETIEKTVAQPARDLEGDMHNSPGQEDEEAQRVDYI